MECNEVFSVSSSVALVPPRTGTDEEAAKFAWNNTPPVRSLATAAHNRLASKRSDPQSFVGTSTVDSATQKAEGSPVSEMGDVEKKRRWIDLCHCRRDLLAIKLFYFAFLGALGVVLPYMAVFLKQLGLSAYQIGIISGVRPALGFISGPLWGAIADRFQIRRILMMISMLSWLGFFVALYMVQSPERVPCPTVLEPHRPLYRLRRGLDDNKTSESGLNTSYISPADQELLREDLSWMYSPSSLYIVFITCLLLICGGELFQAPTTAMSDAATLQILGREELEHYGAQRAWGPIGWAVR